MQTFQILAVDADEVRIADLIHVAANARAKCLLVSDALIFKDVRREYSGGKIIYEGWNVDHKAAIDAETWFIWKKSWDGDDNTRTEGFLIGTWEGRDSLAWAS